MARSADTPQRYQVRSAAFQRYGGQNLDEGQIIVLAGMVNDEKLVRLNYCSPFNGTETFRCAECGAEFNHDSYRTAHGRRRHPVVPVPEFEAGQTLDERDFARWQASQDAEAERVNRSLKENPLALDKTLASQRG